MQVVERKLGISYKKFRQVSRSQLIEGFGDHSLSLTFNKLFNGLPPQPLNDWPTGGIKTATCYNSGSSILKLLQLVYFRFASTAPNRTAVSKMRFYNASVEGYNGLHWQEGMSIFKKSYCPRNLTRNWLDLFSPVKRTINYNTEVFSFCSVLQFISTDFQMQGFISTFKCIFSLLSRK